MKVHTRREFIKNSLFVAGAICTARPALIFADTVPSSNSELKRIKIHRVDSDFEREPLIRPFGFKGGALTELWQTVNFLESESGIHQIGLSTQSILWSDAAVFAAHSESGGNALMYALTEKALQLIKEVSFTTPIELLEHLFPELYAYGKTITSNPHLRKTFVLNAMVGVDNAAWLLYAKENNFRNFDEMIPEHYRKTFSFRHDKVASIPLISYNVPVEEVIKSADEGYFFLKIKIGQSGSQTEMLEKDKARISEIHNAIKNKHTSYTTNGKLAYYLDANGRYENKETLLKLLAHAKKIGAFDQIAIIEEPFPEEQEIDVSDIPVRIAADESAHTDEDALKRIQLGYKAITLKAIAKTLSMTMKIAKVAYKHDIPCFCADLTVNPILVDWNKNVAARLKPFPGLGNLSLLESNGDSNYVNWTKMMEYHPQRSGSWVKKERGIYNLDQSFYSSSGGIFDKIPHYEKFFHKL